MDPANAAIAAAYALASNTGAAGAGSLAPSTAALTAWNAPPGLSALSASAAASAPSAIASPLPLPLVMLCSRPEMRGDLSRIVSGLSLDGVPGVSPSDSVVAASSSPSMPLLFARFLIMPKAVPPLLSEPLPPLPYPDLDPSDRRRTALSLPTLRCALLLGSVMRTSRVFLTVSSLRLASAAPPSPGPSSAWMMLSSFFTLRYGQRVMPCSRHRCFRTVTHSPSLRATSLMGRWKFALSSSSVRLFDCPLPRFLGIFSH
mmetsp:Transcript_12327/g.57044  ORF Transcript_12327/g.57044 Transcript_12327/m.57044 type:complete len:259 (+) Transcript_12327:672-1448(+)